jgi:DNA-binding transcriptional ArsR family regulator
MSAAAGEEHIVRASRILSAMANEKRLRILCEILGGEKSVTVLATTLGVRQSTVSQHLALLRKCGLVRTRRDGQTQYYSLTSGDARRIIETLYEADRLFIPSRERGASCV